jgi:glutaredoxin 3
MQIKIFTTPTCPHCKQAKEYLSQRDVTYTEFNVAENKDALKEMVEITGRRSVPVIVCGNDVLVGYSPSRLDQLIECEKNQTSLDRG